MFFLFEYQNLRQTFLRYFSNKFLSLSYKLNQTLRIVFTNVFLLFATLKNAAFNLVHRAQKNNGNKKLPSLRLAENEKVLKSRLKRDQSFTTKLNSFAWASCSPSMHRTLLLLLLHFSHFLQHSPP